MPPEPLLELELLEALVLELLEALELELFEALELELFEALVLELLETLLPELLPPGPLLDDWVLDPPPELQATNIDDAIRKKACRDMSPPAPAQGRFHCELSRSYHSGWSGHNRWPIVGHQGNASR